MSIESTRALGPLFFHAQDRLLGGPAAELCVPGYSATIGGNPSFDLAGHQAFARAFYAAFPDLHHTIEETVAEQAKVAVRFVLRGTHTGTRRAIEVNALAILHVAEDKVTELRANFDQIGMMKQLGVME
jgi:predicted ester cyclase